ETYNDFYLSFNQLKEGDSFQLAPDEDKVFDVILPQSAVVVGPVKAPRDSNQHVSFASVVLYDAETGETVGANAFHVFNDQVDWLRIGVPEGSYKVAFKDNYYLDEYYDDTLEWEEADVLNLEAGTVTTVSATLDHGGVISGVVTTDDTNDPMRSIRVDAFARNEFCSGEDLEPNRVAWTQSDGSYRLSGFAPGTYTLKFSTSTSIPDELDRYETLTETVVISRGEQIIFDKALPLAGTISGTVTSETDALPISGLRITLFKEVAGEWVDAGGTYSNERGQYFFDGVDQGLYTLVYHPSPYFEESHAYIAETYGDQPVEHGYVPAGTPQTLVINTGLEVTGVDVQLERGGQISGTVFSADPILSLAEADVQFYSKESGESFTFIGSVLTDNLGKYTTYGLPEGEIYLYFQTDDNEGEYRFIYLTNSVVEEYIASAYPSGRSIEVGQPIDVVAGEIVDGIDITLSKGATLRGRALTGSSLNTYSTFSNVKVFLYNSNGEVVKERITNEYGDFSFTGVPPGVYYAMFDNFNRYASSVTVIDEGQCDYLYGGVYYGDAKTFEEASPIIVTDQMPQRFIDGEIDINGKQVEAPNVETFPVSGRVLDSEGAGLAGVFVTTDTGIEGVTNDQGIYTLSLAARSYQLNFEKAGFEFETLQVEVVDRPVDATDVQPVQEVTLNLLSGRVVDSQGNGIEDVAVLINGETGQDVSVTSSGGSYSVTVSPGTYVVTPSKEGVAFNPPFAEVVVADGDIVVPQFVAIDPNPEPNLYEVSGQIVDDSDQPMQGVEVVVTNWMTETTDSFGQFTLTLLAGEYLLTPVKEGITFTPQSLTINLPADQNLSVKFVGIQAIGPPIDPPIDEEVPDVYLPIVRN
ncbi:MAG: carboxypeptidase regulatory-like domain-containing protein, partial [Chloroflexota bacterium]